MKRQIAILIILIFALITLSALAQETKKVNAPKAVTEAFSKSYPNAKILSVSKEKEQGKVTFEIESMDGKTRRDLIFDEKGNVLEYEELISTNELPNVILDKISKDFAKASITKAEKLFKDKLLKYELAMNEGKKKFSLTFDEKGQLEKK